ncbi:MAG TPA: NFACT RNA binding domain-containing protein [Bdellovibrionota bacterium]|jgi:predicted ribosome quality control (RQC) complex YloA/Tae2 family protein
MSLKWKEISLLLEEARPVLMGSALQKVAQARELAAGETFSFQGFGHGGPWRLWACLLQDNSCWVLAKDDWKIESQPEPSNFVMVLRKRLLGKRVVSLEQVRNERFLLMHFEEGVSLLFELLPKRANIVLLENWNREERTGRFIQSFRQVSLESGGIYRLPPAPVAGTAAGNEVREFAAEAGAPFPFHSAIGEKYWAAVQKTGFSSYQRLWRQVWKSHGKKVKTALENAREDFEEGKEAELFQKRGMALVAHLYELGPKKFPKEKKIELDGVEIALDGTKTYSDNAEACFKKAKKLHRAVRELEGRVAELEKKSEHVEKVAKSIEAATEDCQLEKLTKEFEKEGLDIPERPDGQEEKGEPAAKEFLEIQSSDGFKIICGRNQEENRRVTFRESKGNDLWMHVKGLPGAHVVIKEQRNKTVPLSTLLEAAQLCLYHSRIRKGKRAEVDYTQRKHVKAIKGTLAEVTYTGNKTIYVESDPEALKKIMR